MTALAPTRGGPRPDAGNRTALPSWLRDLILGLRLAVGGGRTSATRIVLGTIGIGLAVAVLLLASSAETVLGVRDAREAANNPVEQQIAGVAPLQMAQTLTIYHGQDFTGSYVQATGPNSPVPPGLSRLPRPGEIVLSPALADLLNSPQGALLRPRFPEHVIGTIGQTGLIDPRELNFYAGANDLSTSPSANYPQQQVYAWGTPLHAHASDPQFIVLIVLGAVALLVPILLFVAVTSRIAGAQRDRRLAALRLVGAGGRQVRRIAAAEALVPAGLGLLLGTGVFLVLRQLAGGVEIFGLSVFTKDLVPPWPLAVLVLLVVPALAVGTSLFAMRRTVIEPLGVLRQAKPIRRRMIWRFAVIVVGIGLLLISDPNNLSGSTTVFTLSAGITLVLIGIPVVLPWLLERVVGLLRGGRPSWQLAVRRLQLDSGTPSRVVGGIAVVLAAAVAVQTLLFGAFQREEVQQHQAEAASGQVTVSSHDYLLGEIGRAVQGVPGAQVLGSTREVTAVNLAERSAGDDDSASSVTVADCAVMLRELQISSCTDGQVFRVAEPGGRSNPTTASGARLGLVSEADSTESAKPVSYWTVPADVRTASARDSQGDMYLYDLVVTPGALRGVVLPPSGARTLVHVDPNRPDELEYLRNAVAPFTWHADVEAYSDLNLSTDQATFQTIQTAIYLGALFTLGMAGVSMLVLALEQVRERRRPLAALAASGVPRAVLARSLLWQTAIPVVVGVAIAVGTGIGLGALMLRLSHSAFAVDWSMVGLFAGATVVLVLLVTALTLPSLRGATRLNALRTE